jgi:S-adenosyl-L-methionine hydrolase (adenosine-forming)
LEETVPYKQRLISLTTDYGAKDFYLAKLKASIYKECKRAIMIDVVHELPIYDITTAAYNVKNVIDAFDIGDIHLLSVNNQYSTNPRFIAYQKNGQYFIGPDNGIFSLIDEDFHLEPVYQILMDGVSKMDAQSHYIHSVSCLYNGLSLADLGELITEPDTKLPFKPVISAYHMRATVIHIDSYGNVVTNLERTAFEEALQGRKFRLYYNPHDPLDFVSRSYASVGIGEPLCLFNEANQLEIAINMGNASTLLNLKLGETIQIDFVP